MTTTTEASTKAERLLENLRTITATIESHPDLPIPYITTSTYDGGVEAHWFLTHGGKDPNVQKHLARQIMRTLGGTWDKDPHGGEMSYRQGAPLDPIRYHVLVVREAVCTRVVTGTETVTIPAVEAQPERTETRETYEWVCGPILAEDGAA